MNNELCVLSICIRNFSYVTQAMIEQAHVTLGFEAASSAADAHYCC